MAKELTRGVAALLAECEGGLDADADEAIAAYINLLLEATRQTYLVGAELGLKANRFAIGATLSYA